MRSANRFALCGQGAAAAIPVLPKKEESGVLMVMNLPDSLTDDHVRELLSPFGELKRFNLLKVRTLRYISSAWYR